MDNDYDKYEYVNTNDKNAVKTLAKTLANDFKNFDKRCFVTIGVDGMTYELGTAIDVVYSSPNDIKLHNDVMYGNTYYITDLESRMIDDEALRYYGHYKRGAYFEFISIIPSGIREYRQLRLDYEYSQLRKLVLTELYNMLPKDDKYMKLQRKRLKEDIDLVNFDLREVRRGFRRLKDEKKHFPKRFIIPEFTLGTRA